tara:strand:- start:929 stop:1744 length:816 start_codon:yes stop_codon:yes gene_type:complete
MNKVIFIIAFFFLGCSSIQFDFDKKDKSSNEESKANEDSDKKILNNNIAESEPFFHINETIGGLERELDDLRARVIEYESKIAAPTITTDILRQFPINNLKHKITLENGTIIEGTILSENLDRIIVDTKIGQIAIDKGKISEREELADASANIEKVSEPKISKGSKTVAFEGMVENKGSIKADFVRVIFKVWDMDPIDGGDVMGPPIAIDSAFVKGEYVEYLSGIVTDSSIREGNQASYRVVVKLPEGTDPDSPTHWTQEINWVKYPIPQK